MAKFGGARRSRARAARRSGMGPDCIKTRLGAAVTIQDDLWHEVRQALVAALVKA